MSWWKKLLWVGISALGVWAMAVLALSRGEQISAFWIVLAGFCALSISYRFYSESLDGFRPSLCGNCRTRAIGRSGVGGAVWVPARHSLDPDWCDARRRRARYDCSLRLD